MWINESHNSVKAYKQIQLKEFAYRIYYCHMGKFLPKLFLLLLITEMIVLCMLGSIYDQNKGNMSKILTKS